MTNQAMDHLPRNERRLLLKAEARNRGRDARDLCEA